MPEEFPDPRSGHRPAPVAVWGLHIPARPDRPCRLDRVTVTAVGISDAIGGGLLDEVLCPAEPGRAHTVYQDADRDAQGLPDNSRAQRLAARLGWPHLTERLSLRGDVLVLGVDARGQDTHLPGSVIEAAMREDLLPGGTCGAAATPPARSLPTAAGGPESR